MRKVESKKIISSETFKKLLNSAFFEFLDFLDDNGINYSLAYGTMLGGLEKMI